MHGSVARRCLMIDSETNSTVPTPGTHWSIPFTQDPPDDSQLVGISESLGQTGVPTHTPGGRRPPHPPLVPSEDSRCRPSREVTEDTVARPKPPLKNVPNARALNMIY